MRSHEIGKLMGGQMPALGYGANTAITNVVNTSGINIEVRPNNKVYFVQ